MIRARCFGKANMEAVLTLVALRLDTYSRISCTVSLVYGEDDGLKFEVGRGGKVPT